MIKRLCGNCWYWNPNKPESKKCKSCGEGRKYFFPRSMICQICDAPMKNVRHEFFECQYCGTETYPFFKNPNDREMIREEFEKTLPCDRNTDVSKGLIHVHSKTNGNNKNSRRKKQPIKKKSTTQLYKELAQNS